MGIEVTLNVVHVVGGRCAGLPISQTADLLDISHWRSHLIGFQRMEKICSE